MSEEFDGESLRNWRKQRGIKREDIAKACHVSVVAVHNWENGRNKPHAAIIPIIEGMMNGEIALLHQGLVADGASLGLKSPT